MADPQKAPLIGSEFSGPPGNTPRSDSSLQSKETKENTDSKITEDDKPDLSGKKDTSDRPLTAAEKAERYAANLKALAISSDLAREVIDSVVSKGVYVRTFKLGGKLTVGIRTRIYDDLERVLHALEDENPTFPVHTDDLVARYNVAASLAFYGDRTFDFPEVDTAEREEVEAAFHVRLKFLRSLPTPVVTRLINETGKFDVMIEAIFAEGAPEDF